MSKPPATPGHKCLGISTMVHVNCECGWSSPNCKFRKDAYSEWRAHVAEQHPTTCPDRPDGGPHEYTADLEYDHTGNTINCEHCGDLPPTKKGT